MQLSCLAEAMGMKVLYFDIAEKLNFGNAERAPSLQSLLARSDVVSLHVPETAATNLMIGKAELAAMRNGSYLINNSRGSIVDLEALADELRSGRLAGAAVDVFPEEPRQIPMFCSPRCAVFPMSFSRRISAARPRKRRNASDKKLRASLPTL